MALELRLLQSFLAVHEERHLGRAAARLSLTQPALTRQMQVLEARVGVQLLRRLPRGVELTEAGKVLAAHGRRVIVESERALDQTRRAARGEYGHLAIGFIASAADRTMAPLLHDLRDRHPGVTFSLTERTWDVQTDGLQSGLEDVAFVRDLVPDAPWRTLELITEPLCVVLRADHRLATRDVLGSAEMRVLSREPFLSVRDWIAPVAARWRFQARLDEDVSSPPALIALVRAGFGNSLMPASYEPAGGDVRFVPIAGEVSHQQLAWPEPVERPAVRLLLELAEERFA